MNRFEQGIFNIYKPAGPSSYDIIRKIKRMSDERRIGHGGTLDPLASGVLVVAIGRKYTKQLTNISKLDKEYIANIELGRNSTTDDAEGDKEKVNTELIPTKEDIAKCIKGQIGDIDQLPPIYSAKKINGEPAYKKARRGESVELKPKKVSIYSIDIINYKYPNIKIDVRCSSGTYIRSIARDLGKCLNTGAFLKSLKRTRVGKYKIDNSIKLDEPS